MPLNEHWNLRIDPALSGTDNMQVDLGILQMLEGSGRAETFVRFYQWDRPTVSIGKHQVLERAVDLASCRRRNVPVVRRPTGGRAVLHADELTYAVISSDYEIFPAHCLSATYRKISEALACGLRSLGLEAELYRGTSPVRRGSDLKSPCFLSPSRSEILAAGRKLAGSAQRRLKTCFLQHGSIPLSVDYPLMAELLGVSEALLRRQMTSLSEVLPADPQPTDVIRALQAGFQEYFGIRFADPPATFPASLRPETWTLACTPGESGRSET